MQQAHCHANVQPQRKMLWHLFGTYALPQLLQLLTRIPLRTGGTPLWVLAAGLPAFRATMWKWLLTWNALEALASDRSVERSQTRVAAHCWNN